MNNLAISPMPYEWYFDEIREGQLPEEMSPYKMLTITFRCPDYSVYDEILKPMADYLVAVLEPYIMEDYSEYIKEQ